jgi:5-formyltetrahydrofolate cyclo-ligase
MTSKGDLRRQFRTQNAAMANLESELSPKVSRVVTGYLRSRERKGPVACFHATPGEPDLQSAILELEQEKVEVAFPAIAGDGLHFYKVDRVGQSADQWTEGPYGLREPNPKTAHQVPLSQIATVLVPGLAFDRSGGRLGRGKGFYDRALENFKGTKVGVAFSQQLSQEELPMESHDIRMDVIITELGVHFTRERVL